MITAKLRSLCVGVGALLCLPAAIMAVAGLICMSCHVCVMLMYGILTQVHTRLCCLSWKAGAQSGLLSASNTQPYSMLLFLLQWRYLSDSAPTSTLHQAGEFLRFQSAWYCAAGLQLALVVLQQQQYVAAGCTAALVVSIPCYVFFLWSGVAV